MRQAGEYFDQDKAGRLWRTNAIRTTQLSRTTPGAALVTVAGYDAFNRKTIEMDANGAVATWRYDYFGALTGHMDIGGAHYGHAYDNARQLIAQSNTRGRNLLYQYDAAAQLTRIEDNGAGQAQKITQYGYDLAAGRDPQATVDARGRLATAAGPGAQGPAA